VSAACLILVAACGGVAEPSLDARSAALTAAPSITALNVMGSPLQGGRMVLIIGTNLDPAASVTFGGALATPVANPDPAVSGLTVLTPPHDAGFVDVTVTNPDGQSAGIGNFHYGPPPGISAVSPTSVRKGDKITISGANFESVLGVQVSIGGAIAQFASKSATQLVVYAPKLNEGISYQLSVANFDSQSAVASQLISYPVH
jgi:hypothetical protein